MNQTPHDNSNISQMLDKLSGANDLIKVKIDELKEKNDYSLISILFELFASLYFDNDESEQYWADVTSHRNQIRDVLKRDVGIKVAILDYFSNIENKIKNPKIVEMELFEQVLRASKEDPKTQLYNSAHFCEVLENELNKSMRNDFELSLLFLDIDNFKEVNDRYGHLFGDQFIFHLSTILKKSVRGEDVVARFGGDEFIILLPHTNKSSAFEVAKRIFSDFHNNSLLSHHDENGTIGTISIGIASFPDDAITGDDLISKADNALYSSKENGKNTITLYSNDTMTIYDESEKRQFRRFNGNKRSISCHVADSNDHFKGYMCNISEGGMLLEIPHILPLLKGLKLDLDMTDNDNKIIKIKGEVSNARKYRKTFLAGIKFNKQNSTIIKKFEK